LITIVWTHRRAARWLAGGCSAGTLLCLLAGPAAAAIGEPRPLAAPVIEIRPLAAAAPTAPLPAALTTRPAMPRLVEPARLPVALRSGEHPGFRRVVFDWPEIVRYEVSRAADLITLRFGRAGAIDPAGLRGLVGGPVRAIDASDDGRLVMLRIDPAAQVRAFDLDGRIIVVDLHGGSSPADALPPAALATGPTTLQPGTLAGGQAALTPPPAQLAAPAKLAARPAAAAPAAAEAAAAPPARPSAPAAQVAAKPAAAPAPASAGPGQFEVDEDAVDRALERTLVDVGALLLPPGKVELAPAFSYVRRESRAPFVVAQTEVRRNELTASLPLRVGLPLDAQLELSVPYRIVDQSQVLTVGFAEQEAVDGTGHGFGDLRLGLAKTLWQEDGGLAPDVIGRIAWDSDFGDDEDNGVPLGGGFHELSGSLSLLKRQDPLAFFGSLSYETTFEKDGIEPGDDLGLSIGTILAASPDTSLRMALDQSFVQNTTINGQEVDGTDKVASSLSLGASSVLGRGVLLNAAVDVGLTDDAPDYAVSLSLPIRFDVPRRPLRRLDEDEN
jgi:hypothetical protein